MHVNTLLGSRHNLSVQYCGARMTASTSTSVSLNCLLLLQMSNLLTTLGYAPPQHALLGHLRQRHTRVALFVPLLGFLQQGNCLGRMAHTVSKPPSSCCPSCQGSGAAVCCLLA